MSKRGSSGPALRAMVNALRVDADKPFIFMGHEFVLSDHPVAKRKQKQQFRAPMRKRKK